MAKFFMAYFLKMFNKNNTYSASAEKSAFMKNASNFLQNMCMRKYQKIMPDGKIEKADDISDEVESVELTEEELEQYKVSDGDPNEIPEPPQKPVKLDRLVGKSLCLFHRKNKFRLLS